MKKTYLLIVLALFTLSSSAQFIYNDFDANQNVPFTGGNPDPTIIANPHVEGINTSANVAEWVRGGWDWSHAKASFDGFIDFTTGTVFTLKVYSPLSTNVKFKLEGPGGNTEIDQPVTAGSWQELSFDFTGQPNDAFNTIVIFFDPGTSGSDIYYFDDVEGPEYSTVVPKPYLAANVQDNFEDDGWGTINEWFFQDPDMNPLPTIADPMDATNTVADYNRSGAFQWTNTQAVLDHIMDLRERNSFEIKVYFPSSNDYTGSLTPTAAIKLQNSLLGGNAWTTQVEIVQTVTTFDDWATLTFDFSGAFDRTDLDQIVVQFGGEGHNETGQFYFDDLVLLIPDYPEPEYTYNDFDDNQNDEFSGDPVVPVIVANPDVSGINTSANCMEYLKSEADWAFVYTELDELINFENGTNFQLKVHSAVVADVTFKLENRYASWISTERTATIANTDEWVLLNFNFSDAPSNTYSKIVIFFGFNETMGETFYFDDVVGPAYNTPKEYLEENVQDNFEDDGWSTLSGWIFQDPNMDPLNTTTDPIDPNNTVADYNRTGSFPYTNAQVELDHRLDLTERNKFELIVYFPSTNDYSGDLAATAAIKLQNSLYIENAWWTQEEIVQTITNFDVWDTLTFDFGYASDRTDFDQLVIQLGGEGHNVPAQFYFDELYLKHVPFVTILSPNGGEEIEQNSSYNIEWDYGWWDGAVDIELIKDGSDPEPITLNLPASDSVFEWIVFADQEPGDDYRIIITSLDDPILTDTSDAFFTIVEVDGVQANFSAEPKIITEGESVIFTDLSSGDPDTWEWYFEGGTPETFNGQTPPEIFYENPGFYDVSLTVFNGDDTDITLKEDYIEVTEVIVLSPPTNLLAEVGDIDDVHLTWVNPVEGNIEELVYDNGVADDAYQWVDYTMSTHMSPAGPCKVLSMKFYTTTQAGDNTFNATLFDWDGDQPSPDITFMQTATGIEEDWVEVDVSSEDIMFDGDFVVGFGSINETTFVGFDGSLDNGRSWDYDNTAMTWETWNEAYLIRAVVEYMDGSRGEVGGRNVVTPKNITPKKGLTLHKHPEIFGNVTTVDPIDNREINNVNLELLGYNVYRDGSMINTAIVETEEYTDSELPIGTVEYYVTAVYEAGESDPSNVVSVVITDVNEFESKSIAVYPNPTDGIFTITFEGQVSLDISMINMTGKEVLRRTVDQTSTFNVSELESGIYFLRVHDKTSNKVNFKKIIVR